MLVGNKIKVTYLLIQEEERRKKTKGSNVKSKKFHNLTVVSDVKFCV
jgi:hypothetical protein